MNIFSSLVKNKLYYTLKLNQIYFIYKTVMADYKAYIKSADMTEDMQQDAIECAVQALQSESVHK